MAADYFHSIRHLHYNVLQPVHKRVGLKRHRQLPIFDGVKDNNHHVKMGLFYELMTSALFGGALVDRIVQLESEHRYLGCKPDVKSRKRSTFTESKAVKQGAHLNLLTDQIKRYLALQIINPDYDIYFVVWRHRIKGVIKDDRTDGGFRNELEEATLAGIKIPLSLINTMYENVVPEVSRQYQSPGWDCVSVKSPFLNGLILDPQTAISKISDPDQYKWTRFQTPKDLLIDGIIPQPFPIIVIKDRTRQWVRNLIEEVPF